MFEWLRCLNAAALTGGCNDGAVGDEGCHWDPSGGHSFELIGIKAILHVLRRIDWKVGINSNKIDEEVIFFCVESTRQLTQREQERQPSQRKATIAKHLGRSWHAWNVEEKGVDSRTLTAE